MSIFDHDPEPEIYCAERSTYLEKENKKMKKLLEPVIPIMTYISVNSRLEDQKKKALKWLKTYKELT